MFVPEIIPDHIHRRPFVPPPITNSLSKAVDSTFLLQSRAKEPEPSAAVVDLCGDIEANRVPFAAPAPCVCLMGSLHDPVVAGEGGGTRGGERRPVRLG
jgi:hypothetical protein